MDSGRLIIARPAGGTRNMAVDDVLLESASESGKCSLRFYGWSEPTLSIGYFQKHSDRSSHPASCELPWVRRASGGGAIVHHLELTYCFVAPVSRRQTGSVESLYYSFHETLVETLLDWKVKATLCPQDSNSGHPGKFLCFQRRSAGDLLIGDVKIAGSAQRRYRRAVMQHGSILLRQSDRALELPGIKEVTNVEISRLNLVHRWLPRISRRLRLELQKGRLERDELRMVSRCERAKFTSRAWRFRR